MKIAIIGGGPAGLYFAILMKKQDPAREITVYERNRPDDTFGFGVVFSDATLDGFERYDEPSYRRITQEFAYWDDIAIHFKGDVHRIGGNGFCGCSRRTLLLILQDRARELGVELVFEAEVDDESRFADADLIIAADGINSRIREKFAEHFAPQVDLRPNKFAWMGSTKPLDAFTFIFQETQWGPFIAHAYQYEKNRSTWVFETDPDTYDRAGLASMTEEESAALMKRVFAEHLDGHEVITNRSLWRNFPMIRNTRWVKDNIVLLGDAKSTAHFSIGSGTKLAMEDAIALYESVRRQPRDVPAALAAFETVRREETEKTQHAADVSLVWFEHVARFWDFDPVKFAFGLMTRAKAITYDNLRLRAPEFVAEVDRLFAREVCEAGFAVDVENPHVPMFQPFRLRDMVVANRAVMSPMCMYSATDGVPNDFHLVHYGSRAIGGPGLMFTEMVVVSPEARITPGCAGIWTDEQEAQWARIVSFVRANSETKICLQLGHAGRKGATKLMWEGMDRPLSEGGWEVCSASPLPYFPDSAVPREIDRAGMDKVKADFVAAVERAERVGFDMVELHCAHGYLLASFLSPLTNRRTDEYGGSIENRLRFPLEVFEAMRAAWPAHKPMSVRISATDWAEGGLSPDDSVAISRAFAQAGVDLIDVSTGQTVRESRPVFGRMFQTPFSDRIRNEARVATMCVGNITTADQINTILAAGRADLVALGRPHLVDPSFVMKASAWYGVKQHCPPQYQPGQDQIFRNSVRDRADLEDLKIRGKPKTRAELKAEAAGVKQAAE
ncbi:bifunctional salicylyl-CoA 5-hydroxylase/oxidoreductase [Salinarimonas ramus]|uniref:NADH:flavin oxidoreductase n=1 Tax=Salinarimonas ramus TaxID=690164 RepID=A0A917Q9H0_9HYPH|nr:bifunctional salicylyl-CoA 5-hydroxylase/oxidoreductase [Salinarimonas ramus]GGK36187.1 NADH:flavin oxidoreductase [Salinarimonas ramus]